MLSWYFRQDCTTICRLRAWYHGLLSVVIGWLLSWKTLSRGLIAVFSHDIHSLWPIYNLIIAIRRVLFSIISGWWIVTKEIIKDFVGIIWVRHARNYDVLVQLLSCASNITISLFSVTIEAIRLLYWIRNWICQWLLFSTCSTFRDGINIWCWLVFIGIRMLLWEGRYVFIKVTVISSFNWLFKTEHGSILILFIIHARRLPRWH